MAGDMFTPAPIAPDRTWDDAVGERTVDPLHASRGLMTGLVVAPLLWVAIGALAKAI